MTFLPKSEDVQVLGGQARVSMQIHEQLHIPIKLSTDSGESFHEYSGGVFPLIPVQTFQSFSLLAQQDCCFRFSL